MRIDDRRSFQAIDGLLSYPSTPGEPFSPGLRARCARLFAALRARWRDRRAAEELAALNDHMLEDIGLTRADLPLLRRGRWFDDLR
jgi:uncharacterized protein YjiS (DUF1127 family)